MSNPRQIPQDKEIDFLRAAYSHPGEPIPWDEHEAKDTLSESLERSQVCGWFVELNATVEKPQRFFLSAWHSRSPLERLASKGLFPRLRDAREHLEEFSKALLAMLAILAPLLVPGGGL